MKLLIEFFLIVILLAAFFLGNYLLENLGIQYIDDGGGHFVKIHLYSYLLILMSIVMVLKYRNNELAAKLFPFYYYFVFSFSALIFFIIFSLIFNGFSGLAYLVNTFISAYLIVFLLSFFDEGQINKIMNLIGFLLLTNSMVSIFEFFFQTRIVDVDFPGFDHFRSSAFLTHPLNNALITVGLTLVLFNKIKINSSLFLIISSLSLFAYGGRAALAIFIISFMIIMIPNVYNFVFKGLILNKLNLSFTLLFSYLLMFIFIFILIQSNISERIIEKLNFDDSAEARFNIIYLLEQLSFDEWFLGSSQSLIENVEFYTGVVIIENYFVGWLLNYGLIGSVLLIISLFVPLFRFYQYGSLQSKTAIISFIIISLTNNSLMTKTPALLLLFAVLYCTYRIDSLKLK